ncbi:hypothetical protein MRX96_018454 [Rhipicephalus microplus]
MALQSVLGGDGIFLSKLLQVHNECLGAVAVRPKGFGLRLQHFLLAGGLACEHDDVFFTFRALEGSPSKSTNSGADRPCPGKSEEESGRMSKNEFGGFSGLRQPNALVKSSFLAVSRLPQAARPGRAPSSRGCMMSSMAKP